MLSLGERLIEQVMCLEGHINREIFMRLLRDSGCVDFLRRMHALTQGEIYILCRFNWSMCGNLYEERKNTHNRVGV